MQFPIEAAIVKRAYIFKKECCNTSMNIIISNEEVSAKNMQFSKIMSILCQTVVHWHCWHGASSKNASCHLANTSCYLANLYKTQTKKQKKQKQFLQTSSDMLVFFVFCLFWFLNLIYVYMKQCVYKQMCVYKHVVLKHQWYQCRLRQESQET